MTYSSNIYGVIDNNNYQNTSALSNQTLTGNFVDISNYSNITISISVNQSSVKNGLQIYFSPDTINFIVRSYTINVPVSGTTITKTYTLATESKYYKINYTNGTIDTSSIIIQPILNANKNEITFLQGQTTGNYIQPVSISNEGYLNVKLIGSTTSAFGDPRVVNPIPITQFTFVYGINSNYVLSGSTGSGSVTESNQLANIISGTTAGSNAYVRSQRYINYKSGQGRIIRFSTVFSNGILNNTQIAGIGNGVDGYFFGYNGTSFGILYLRNSVPTWIPQTSWSNDVMDGSCNENNKSGILLKPINGNVYQISISYLGFGDIYFYIYSSVSPSFVLVHVLRYLNLNIVPSVTNPSMYLLWQNTNNNPTGPVSGTTLSVGSAAAFNDGDIIPSHAQYSRSNPITGLTTTPTSIINIRNNTTINGSIINRSTIKFENVSFYSIDSSASANANSVTLNIILNPTITGSPTYTNIDSVNSIASYSTNTVYTVGTGTIIQSYSSPFTAGTTIDLSPFELCLDPGDYMIFALNSLTTAASVAAGVSVSWCENT